MSLSGRPRMPLWLTAALWRAKTSLTSLCMDFGDVLETAYILKALAVSWCELKSFGQKDIFNFNFLQWQQIKWRLEIELTGFVFKNVKVLRQIYLEMCYSRTIAFYRIYHCLRCRSSSFFVVVFLRLCFWQGCWFCLNAKERKKTKSNSKGFIWSFEAKRPCVHPFHFFSLK